MKIFYTWLLDQNHVLWISFKNTALAKIDSLSAVDEDTGLVTFMFAGLEQNLSVVYNLLLLKPDILKNYI